MPTPISADSCHKDHNARKAPRCRTLDTFPGGFREHAFMAIAVHTGQPIVVGLVFAITPAWLGVVRGPDGERQVCLMDIPELATSAKVSRA